MRPPNTLRPNTILLILALCAGMLAPGTAGAQSETPLDVCLDDKRGWTARVEACRRAAEQGDARAQGLLGAMYAKGYGVPKDHAKAVRWFRLAAEQGNAMVQAALGLMYVQGQGVPQDYAKAVEWYRRAAEQGHAGAQLNLGVMYTLGQGVPEDYVRAHMWYELAAANGSTEAPTNRDAMTILMTPQQIAAAQRMAREWVEKRKGK